MFAVELIYITLGNLYNTDGNIADKPITMTKTVMPTNRTRYFNNAEDGKLSIWKCIAGSMEGGYVGLSDVKASSVVDFFWDAFLGVGWQMFRGFDMGSVGDCLGGWRGVLDINRRCLENYIFENYVLVRGVRVSI